MRGCPVFEVWVVLGPRASVAFKLGFSELIRTPYDKPNEWIRLCFVLGSSLEKTPGLALA